MLGGTSMSCPGQTMVNPKGVRMMRWLCAVFMCITTLSSFAQTTSFDSPASRVSLLELYTSEG